MKIDIDSKNEYHEYKYLWPPRPDTAAPRGLIRNLASRGYAAQKKKNGTYNIVFTDGADVIFKTRHGDDDNHKQWNPLSEHIEFFKSLANEWGGKWCVFCSELIHNKTPHIKNEIYIFDVLVFAGKTLYGSTFRERMDLLTDIFKKKIIKDEGDRFRVHPHVTLARVYTDGFMELYDSLRAEDEGLVFKRMDAKLQPCIRPSSNNDWQIKCRIPHKRSGSF